MNLSSFPGAECCMDVYIPVASENALPCYDGHGYNKILENARPWNDPDGRHLSAFTYLRLGLFSWRATTLRSSHALQRECMVNFENFFVPLFHSYHLCKCIICRSYKRNRTQNGHVQQLTWKLDSTGSYALSCLLMSMRFHKANSQKTPLRKAIKRKEMEQEEEALCSLSQLMPGIC